MCTRNNRIEIISITGCDGHFNVVQGWQVDWIILNPQADGIADLIIFSTFRRPGPLEKWPLWIFESTKLNSYVGQPNVKKIQAWPFRQALYPHSKGAWPLLRQKSTSQSSRFFVTLICLLSDRSARSRDCRSV